MTIERSWLQASLVTLVAVLAALLINPVGYIGGGQDDARYLTAARCWVDHSICLPHNHWQGRWPVFAPIAAIIAVFGEARSTVQLWPLACSIAATLLLLETGRRLFDNGTAAMIAVTFVLIPAFALQLMTPNVEAIELAFVLGAVICILSWKSGRKPIWAFAGGLCFGLAFQVRETAIVAAILALVSLYVTRDRPRLIDLSLAAVGFLLPLAIEFLVYQWATGDFLYRRQLSLNHARIPSSELPHSIDTSRSPLLNREIIGGWKRQPGIQVHWLVDGPLNLILNAKAGFSLLLTPLLLVVGQRELAPTARRMAWLLLGFAALYIAAINYVFAMDPKPRVMLTALAASSMALGLVSAELWRSGRKLLVGASLGSALVGSALVVAGYLRPSWADHQAKLWIEQHPGGIGIDGMTRMFLTLSPELRRLPGFEAGRPYAMVISTSACADWVTRAGLSSDVLVVAGERRLSLFPPIDGSGAWICLLKFRRQITAEEMNRAVRRVWIGPDRLGS